MMTCTMPVALRLKELLKGPKADVPSVLNAAKIYDSDIESVVLVQAETQRWIQSAPTFGTVKNAKE